MTALAIKKTLHLGTLMAVTAVMLWLAGFWTFALYVHALKPQDTTRRTDAIVVLTGGPDRINTGLDLLHEKMAEKLFISGVDARVTTEKLIFLWNGDRESPPCCITLGHEAHNTRQNALEAERWLKQENASSVRLVTSAVHMPRALLEFRHALPDASIVIHPVGKSGNLFRVFEEYNKILFTWLRLTLAK